MASSSEHQPGGPRLGSAKVPVRGAFSNIPVSTFTYRVVPLENAFGVGTDWSPLEGKFAGNEFQAEANVPAGGWYRLEVRQNAEGKEIANVSVAPFGVGEVFLIAGQSYAAGANDALTRVDDPQGRVVALDVQTNAWQRADDPMPHVGDGGTIWPGLGNLLLPVLRVPIGFVNVAVGGTSSRQWLPGEKLYLNLQDAGKRVGDFRFVLWQQGESDVIENTSTEKYVANLSAIRGSLAKSWGFSPLWLLAKSTLHPTVYNNPVGEEKIRLGIERLRPPRILAWPGYRPASRRKPRRHGNPSALLRSRPTASRAPLVLLGMGSPCPCDVAGAYPADSDRNHP
ncbi:MAG: sialate O-acetylesterase [Planctomycetota bacterium]